MPGRHCALEAWRVFTATMILIGFGGNLPSPAGPPPATFQSACRALERDGVRVLRLSGLYVSPPWPVKNGPDFYNLAAVAETSMPPGQLLRLLIGVETQHGRARRDHWGPRTLDLDLLDYWGYVTDSEHLALPHPWIEERAFVLKPIAEIAPLWRHPTTGRTAGQALDLLDSSDRAACRLAGAT